MAVSSDVEQAAKSPEIGSRSLLSKWATAITGFQFDPSKTILRTKTTVILGFAAGLLLSPKLWVSSRFYPMVPIVHGLPRIPYPLDYVCYGILLLLLFMAAMAAKPRIYIFSFLGFIALLSLWDQTRWQPWAYLYWMMLLGLGCYSWKTDDLRGQRDALNIVRLLMAFTYIYSGLQKFNTRFVVEGLPWVVNTLHVHFPDLQYLGWVAACIEISIGLSLLTRRFRRLGVVNGVIMHIFILYSFGPLGRNWNSVVWPWNVVMPTLLIVLFWNADDSASDILWRNHFAFQKVALALFAVLPALSFIGYWPSDLSASLYSANLTEANVLVGDRVQHDLPPYVQQYVKTAPGNAHVLRIQDWSFGELNVPPYAEIQSYLAVGSDICRYTHNSPDVLLTGQEKNTLLGPGKDIRNTCFGTLVVHPLN